MRAAGATVSTSNEVVFLLDVDNTMLDNDRLKVELDRALRSGFGAEEADRFWRIYERVRAGAGYVDFPTTIAALALERDDPDIRLSLDALLEGLSFERYLYPGVMETIEHLKSFGKPVILSDGDKVFQPLKIRKSGLEAAVDGRVLISVHKERELARVFLAFPARHYVVVDDKPRILAVLEEECPTTFTTILLLQGKYAVDTGFRPEPDITLQRFADLKTLSERELIG